MSALLSANSALWNLKQKLSYAQIVHIIVNLECVNIPETVNNSMWLGFSFSISFQSVLYKPYRL